MSVQEQLREFIVAQFMYEQNNKSLDPDDDLLNQGIVDSMGILQVVNFMEEKFGIHVNDEEITPENFRSLRTLTDLVMQKNGAAAMA
ncbi:MAG: acyl carrier protein [candidate division KSB1 bacterium]|nr:acyl carrier protein [candidate division KSB1 bacterium]MDZ7364008.1 acyl carrier protein [candidate division KSB1 bacterium]MDZ7369231.1 acyl carrier protein [candidate division KSB1 bacterium]MDZ7407235.1 acyl carrier protein [candidate division KSB1 bacterium]